MKPYAAVLVSLVAIFFGAWSCAKKEKKKKTTVDTSFSGSCVEIVGAFTKCDDYTAVTAAERKAAESGCLASSTTSTWYEETCNPDGALGLCSTNFPDGSAYSVYYFGDYTAKTATAVCSAEYGGTFQEL